jgi:hypothetical protein
MYLDNEYPRAEVLGKMLNNETPGTIASSFFVDF